MLIRNMMIKYRAKAAESGDDLPGGDEKPKGDDEEEEEEKPAPSADEGDKPVDKAGDDETEDEAAKREREKNIRIPKSRLDDALAKARAREAALQAEIKRLSSASQTAQQRDAIAETTQKLDELQDKYEDLLLDGKKDEARAVRRAMEKARDDLQELKLRTTTTQASKTALDALKYDAALARVESQYPELNPDSEEFDEDMTNEVAELVEAYVASGRPRHEALNKAVRYVAGAPKTNGAATKAERDAEARKKAARADSRQPPDSSRVGKDHDKVGSAAKHGGIDVLKLTYEDLDKMDPKELARLRGDFL